MKPESSKKNKEINDEIDSEVVNKVLDLYMEYYAALVGYVGVGYSENYGQGELRTYDTETTKNPDQDVGESLLAKLYALC